MLPSSLTRVLPFALVFSTPPPVSVSGTGVPTSSLRGFSRRERPTTSARRLACAPPLPFGGWCLLSRVPTLLHRDGDGILAVCPSATPSGLALGPTHPTRTNLASEPLGVRRMRFSRIKRYSCRHSHFPCLQGAFQYPFADLGNAPLPKIAISLQPSACRPVSGLTADS